MKYLILIFFTILLYQTSTAQENAPSKLNCGNSILKDLQEGDNEICVIDNTNIKLIAKVFKGKIISWSAIEEDGNRIKLKYTEGTSKKEKSNSTGKKPANPPTKNICKPFCVTVNGVKHCSDGCLATY